MAALWWWPLLAGLLPNFMDSITHGYPLRMAVAEQGRAGTLPLWLPNQFSGSPLAANPQLATWYPPHLLFYAWPGALTYGLLCVLHYVWGGWGTYFYVRRFTRSLPAAVFAAVTFQFSAMLVSRIALLPHVYTVVWVPWMLLAVERAVHERGLLPRCGALVFAVLFAMQLLAGSPQISYYTGLLVPVYWLLRAWNVSRASGIEVLAQGAVAAAIGASIAGIQIVPALEFLRNAERAPFELDRLRGQALNDGFIWRSLVGFTGPDIEDTDSINAIGIGAMLLALLALARRRTRRIALPLWAMALAGFLLAIGPLTHLWTSALPLFSSFQAPRRTLMFWTVGASLAAGLGAGALHVWWRARRWPTVGLVAVLGLLSLGTWWMLPRLEREFVAAEHLNAPPAHLAAIGESRFLTLDPTMAYAYDSRRPDYGTAIFPNLAALHGLHDANGYDPLVPARYGMARRIANAGSGILFPSHGVFLSDPNSPLLDMLAVQTLVGRWDLFDPGRVVPGAAINHDQLAAQLELVQPHERWPVYRYRSERPFAWASERVLMTSGAEQATHLALQSGAPRRLAFVEKALSQEIGSTTTTVAVARPDARTIKLRLEAAQNEPVLMCVASPWMPGWVARNDQGAKLEVLPVNGVITGVVVPPAYTEITLRYEPISFLNGLAATALGLLVLLLLSTKAIMSPRRHTRH